MASISQKIAEHHKLAAEHHEAAAEHHNQAAKHAEAGSIEKCESRSNNPSLKRPICLGAPE